MPDLCQKGGKPVKQRFTIPSLSVQIFSSQTVLLKSEVPSSPVLIHFYVIKQYLFGLVST